ncbi:hypothetical protein [Clostridium sp. OM02-18AC]|mgnify:CR=1 FL=1|uniref:hypothetical protein n=1 Tax=Clostridium sp. OM02-18AC TaxID=2292311 RepID=UPI0015FB57F7|nr:hypothetical protein [Clostridium sp. OM02-18AC]
MDKEIKDVFTLDLETTNGNTSFHRRMQRYYEVLRGKKNQNDKTDTQEQKCGNME